MKIFAATLLALFSLAAFSFNAQAGHGGRANGPGMGMGLGDPTLMIEHMADHLDLDDTQRETVENILEAARPEIDALRDQFKANRKALESLDTSDAAYSTELNNIALSNGQLATDATLLITRVRSEVSAVLTEEQLEKLARGKKRLRHAMERRFKRQ